MSGFRIWTIIWNRSRRTLRWSNLLNLSSFTEVTLWRSFSCLLWLLPVSLNRRRISHPVNWLILNHWATCFLERPVFNNVIALVTSSSFSYFASVYSSDTLGQMKTLTLQYAHTLVIMKCFGALCVFRQIMNCNADLLVYTRFKHMYFQLVKFAG